MDITVDWKGNARFDAQTGSGHTVAMDGPPDHGGVNAAPRPMEMMLVGLGGCTSFDVVHILRKSRQAVTGCTASIHAERAAEEPAVFTRINVHFRISGDGLKSAAVARAVELSATKYCSASIMLERAGVEITHSHEIEEAGA